mmetsp:Transcript_39641/g.65722  ORF Transcript_39641/g.65722 Transcript_39641/m.65722 type:complete len:96 (+) Transcript_39641:2-289(+)
MVPPAAPFVTAASMLFVSGKLGLSCCGCGCVLVELWGSVDTEQVVDTKEAVGMEVSEAAQAAGCEGEGVELLGSKESVAQLSSPAQQITSRLSRW